jgi:hypothetical protein
MRDTLLHIFRTLGPLAGWTNHNYDVAQEPTQLLPLYPGYLDTALLMYGSLYSPKLHLLTNHPHASCD